MIVGQRQESFPNRRVHGKKIQHISNDWVTLWARRIPKSLLFPLPSEDEDRDTKHQRVEYRSVEHGDEGRLQGVVLDLYPTAVTE